MLANNWENSLYSGLLISYSKKYGSSHSLDDLIGINALSHTACLELSKQAIVECPRGKKKTTRHHKRSEKASFTTPVASPPKTAYEFCIDFFSDSEDKTVTLQQQQWVIEAFEHLLKGLQKTFMDTHRRSIPESFLLALTSSYLEDLKNIDSAVECFGSSLPEAFSIINNYKDDFLSYFTLIRHSMNIIREGLEDRAYEAGQISPEFELPKFQLAQSGRHGGRSFLVNNLLFGEGDIVVLLSELIDLLCQTLHPFEFSKGSSDDGLIGYLRAASFITNDDVPTPKTDVYTGRSQETFTPHVKTDHLIRELQRYYSSERPVQQLATQLLSIESSPKPAQTVKPKVKTISKSAASTSKTDGSSSPSEESEASGRSRDNTHLSPPIALPSPLSKPPPRPLPPTTVYPRGAIYAPAVEPPEKKILRAFQDAVSTTNLEEAKRLYKENRSIIEGSKSWKRTGKVLFLFLLRLRLTAKEYTGFIKKYDLEK